MSYFTLFLSLIVINCLTFSYDFAGRMRGLFESKFLYDHARVPSLSCLLENKTLTDPAEIEKAINLGEYIKNGESYTST